MMVEVRQNGEAEGVADSHTPFVRLADASAKLFAEQAAAMAMMTAFGMSFVGQMTGLMMGTLGASEDKTEEQASSTPAPASDMGNNVVHLRPETVKRAAPGKSPAKPAAQAVASKTGDEAAGSSRAGRAVAQVAGDDLKRIPGIGPRLEKVLRGRGIISFKQIAGLDDAALRQIDDELGLEGRVTRDDWVGQAKALAAGRA
jgi:NADH-quinone oxidoreductase subunit E